MLKLNIGNIKKIINEEIENALKEKDASLEEPISSDDLTFQGDEETLLNSQIVQTIKGNGVKYLRFYTGDIKTLRLWDAEIVNGKVNLYEVEMKRKDPTVLTIKQLFDFERGTGLEHGFGSNLIY